MISQSRATANGGYLYLSFSRQNEIARDAGCSIVHSLESMNHLFTYVWRPLLIRTKRVVRSINKSRSQLRQ